MGKHDAKQPKLNFDHKRSTRQGEVEQGPQAAEGHDLAADDQGEDLRTLMLEMRSSLRNIDTKLLLGLRREPVQQILEAAAAILGPKHRHQSEVVHGLESG
ncbi:hypothetical protein NDU88_003420 [Pleurodeles waltl]|uniref:Uncharacterized protein n=1 Tax=Pleurodeles waltl TaxID=8319 RepID=A0AAV7M656_PLEWA|nr:hypothetical protein NDU88_003420 [Pleurodeles waltl]